MSVSLEEVLESAGFKCATNPDDARWFLSQVSDFEESKEKAEEVVEAEQDDDFDNLV